MAQRNPQKAKRPAPRSTPVAAAPAAADERIKDLEMECLQLKSELAAAKQRIAALEAAREQVLNRIDWVIDSLHNLQKD